jgi:hypothetical protein
MSKLTDDFEKRLQEGEDRQMAWIKAGRGHEYVPGSLALPTDPPPATPAKPAAGHRALDHLFGADKAASTLFGGSDRTQEASKPAAPAAATVKPNPAHDHLFGK